MSSKSTYLLSVLSVSLLCSAVQADWVLNAEQSSLHFATVKNSTTSEIHHFKGLRGVISEEGKVGLVIQLASVDTANPIRDERMQKQLFETEKFPEATVSLDLGSDGVKPGAQTITATLSLHGVDKEISTQVFVEQDDKTVKVSSLAPVIISAPDFGLGRGVEVLRELAGLSAINMTVPATFRLVYDKQ